MKIFSLFAGPLYRDVPPECPSPTPLSFQLVLERTDGRQLPRSSTSSVPRSCAFSVLKNKYDSSLFRLKVLKLVIQHQKTLIPLFFFFLVILSFFLSSFGGGRSLKVCPFWAHVLVQHGDSVDVAPPLSRNNVLILNLQKHVSYCCIYNI